MKRVTRVSIVTVVFLFNLVVAVLYLKGVFGLWDILQNAGYLNSYSGSDFTDKAVVIGKLEKQDTEWVKKYLPDWQPWIYTVNNQNTLLHTSTNKGHEALAYLTFIIDNYSSLPSTMAFLHSHQNGWWKAWHTDAPDHSNVDSLNLLNLDFVRAAGYVNLRCDWGPGCQLQDRHNAHVTPEHWAAIFGNDTAMPDQIGAACCAQFAVSREQVLMRRREEYIHYRNWVLNTPLPDEKSGRVMEYLWHIIFGQQSVYCPDRDRCYCEAYGRC